MKKFVRSLDFLNNQLISNSFNFCVFLTKNQPLYKQNRFLCPVSGGQDSILCFFLLLHLLGNDQTFYQKKNFLYDVISIKKRKRNVSLSPKRIESKNPSLTVIKQIKKITFYNVYCHHFWQPKNFFCSEFLFQISFVFHISCSFILNSQTSLSENRARGWRKENFSRLLQFQKLSSLLIGHSKSDCLEKNFNNFFRGTSPKGRSQQIFFDFKTITVFFSFILFKPKTSYSNDFKKVKQRNDIFLFAFNLKIKTCFSKLPVKKKFMFSRKVKIQKFRNFHFVSFATRLPFYFQLYKENPAVSKFLILKISYSFCFSPKSLEKQRSSLQPIQGLIRFAISNTVKLYQLPTLSDSTNLNPIFSRNKIRHYFIPLNRFLIRRKLESLATHFFYLVSIEHEKVENEIFEVKFVLKFLRFHSFQTTSKFVIFSKIEKNVKCFVIQSSFSAYREIALNFKQIQDLQYVVS